MPDPTPRADVGEASMRVEQIRSDQVHVGDVLWMGQEWQRVRSLKQAGGMEGGIQGRFEWLDGRIAAWDYGIPHTVLRRLEDQDG